MNRIHWILGVGVPAVFLVVNTLLFFVFDPASLAYGALFGLAIIDRVLGAIFLLPPFISWTIVGFVIGGLIHFFLWETTRAGDTLRRNLIITAGVLVLLVSLVQPFLPRKTAVKPAENAGPVTAPWWRPDSYREAGAQRVYDDIAFSWIPAGSFMMGSPSTEPDRTVDEVQHQVSFERGFWISSKEISWETWLKYVPNPPKAVKNIPDNRELPVFGVTYEEALLFTEVITKITGNHYRLPKETEWEYAGRAGSETAYFFGGDAAELAKNAWFAENSQNMAHPVGSLPPNTWRLFDIHGNVAEWCLSESGNGGGGERVSWMACRGGGWLSSASQCRLAARSLYLPDSTSPPIDIGFRLIREQ